MNAIRDLDTRPRVVPTFLPCDIGREGGRGQREGRDTDSGRTTSKTHKHMDTIQIFMINLKNNNVMERTVPPVGKMKKKKKQT